MSGTVTALLKQLFLNSCATDITLPLKVIFSMNSPEKRYTASDLWYHKARLEYFNK